MVAFWGTESPPAGRIRFRQHQVVVGERDGIAQPERIVARRHRRAIADFPGEIIRQRIDAHAIHKANLAVDFLAGGVLENNLARHVEGGEVGAPVLVGAELDHIGALDNQRGTVLEVEMVVETQRRTLQGGDVERDRGGGAVRGDHRAEETVERDAVRFLRQLDRRTVVAAEVESVRRAEVGIRGRGIRRVVEGDRLRAGHMLPGHRRRRHSRCRQHQRQQRRLTFSHHVHINLLGSPHVGKSVEITPFL